MAGAEPKTCDCTERPPAKTAVRLVLELPPAGGLFALTGQVPRLALTVNETAGSADVSRSFLYEEIAEGRLKAVKLRGATRILIWDWVDYLKTRPALEPETIGTSVNLRQRGPPR